MKDIISNCFLCEEKSLHIVGTEEAQIMQCINCGYVSSTKYIGTKETNEDFKELSDYMKKWSVEKNGRIWIPSIMTLPIGMLYPIDDEKLDGIGEVGDEVKGVMKWAFAPMVEIPESEKENYPNGKGGFYDKKIDTDNPKVYDKFLLAMSYVNNLMKEKTTNGGE